MHAVRTTHEVVPAAKSTRVATLGWASVGVGALAFGLRFGRGLGATTGLSDSSPWGLWIVLDLVWIAVASGAFAVGAGAHLFGGERWRGVARAAVLLGFLSYSFVLVTLVADLGLPWHAWRILVERPEHSAMFEVAWCVTLYLAVLALELVPAVVERFGLSRIARAWRVGTPATCVAILALFVGTMSGSLSWALATAVLYGAISWLVLRRERSREHAASALLAIAGLVLSTMHQSSLGSLFLILPGRLDPLWWSPGMPVEFLFSAVGAGLATVVVLEVAACRAFRRPVDQALLASLSRAASVFLALWVVLRVGSLAARGVLASALRTEHAALFTAETLLATVLAATLFLLPRLRPRPVAYVTGSLLAVAGVALHRLDTVLLAMDRSGPLPRTAAAGYAPSLVEVVSTASLLVATVLLFSLLARSLPILARREATVRPLG